MWNHFVNGECQAISNIIEGKPIIFETRIKVAFYNDIFNLQ